MATMNVSLPDVLKAVVEENVRSGRYANASDYVRDLIRRDEEDRAWRADLLAAHDEGMASGIDPRSPDEIFADIRKKYADKG